MNAAVPVRAGIPFRHKSHFHRKPEWTGLATGSGEATQSTSPDMSRPVSPSSRRGSPSVQQILPATWHRASRRTPGPDLAASYSRATSRPFASGKGHRIHVARPRDVTSSLSIQTICPSCPLSCRKRRRRCLASSKQSGSGCISPSIAPGLAVNPRPHALLRGLEDGHHGA